MNDTKLELRLPSRLKEEFFTRCDEEGYVPSDILRALVAMVARRGPKQVFSVIVPSEVKV